MSTVRSSKLPALYIILESSSALRILRERERESYFLVEIGRNGADGRGV